MMSLCSEARLMVSMRSVSAPIVLPTVPATAAAAAAMVARSTSTSNYNSIYILQL